MSDSNDMGALRGLLFDTIRDLRAGKMDVKIAKEINSTASVLVNSAAVEVEMLKHFGGSGSGFIPRQAPALPPPGGRGMAGQLGLPRRGEDE